MVTLDERRVKICYYHEFNLFSKNDKNNKKVNNCDLPDKVERLLVLGGEATVGLRRPCLDPLIVMERKRLGDVGRRPKKLLPDDAALR